MDVDAEIDQLCDDVGSETRVLSSAVPPVCSSEPCVMGIDEAGRGPVLGPMVYGCAFCPLSKHKDLEQLGCADSKTLTAEAREKLFDKLRQHERNYIGWQVEILSPSFISHNMLKRAKYNLNWMSHDAAIALVQRCLDSGVQVSEVYVDTVGPPEKYQAKLESRFPSIRFTVSKKADSLYATVSAASICAKVVRDRAMTRWRCPERVPLDCTTLGSGYPADPVTKRFLKDRLDPVFGFPSLVRFSWSTCKNILDNDAVPVQWEEIDDDGEGVSAATNTPSITSFFSADGAMGGRRNIFFTDRCLRPAPPI